MREVSEAKKYDLLQLITETGRLAAGGGITQLGTGPIKWCFFGDCKRPRVNASQEKGEKNG